MEKNPMEGGTNVPQDRLNRNGQTNEVHAGSGYQQNKYRQAVGPVAMRAVELLTQGRVVGDSDGVTEVVLPSLDETWPESAPEDAAPAERQEAAKENAGHVLANVYYDPKRHTVSFLLDDVTANTVIYAVRLLAAESEAHAREVRMVGATLPPESYGAANRHVVAARHERIAARLRVLEGNYRTVVGEGPVG